MKLSLGFSPCPNDTFIFDALVNHKIDTAGLEFDVHLEDVQTLNEWAIEGKLDFSKISYGVLPLVMETYTILSSGGALGKGVGPMLISKALPDLITNQINDLTVAIPGKNTTAHVLFSLAYPEAKHKVFTLFHEIEDAVLQEKVAAGVIIHENRFTYHLKGLHKVVDLGEYWETKLNIPIPLGGILAKKSLSAGLAKQMNNLIKKSIAYAYMHHYDQLADYVEEHAQEMSKEVMRKHIDLYVNAFSTDLGDAGKKAVMTLLDVYRQQHPDEKSGQEVIFID